MANFFQSGKEPVGLGSEEVQDPLKARPDQQIDQREEHRKQGRHQKDHAGCQKNLAARGPDDLADFGAGLLDELDRAGASHRATS